MKFPGRLRFCGFLPFLLRFFPTDELGCTFARLTTEPSVYGSMLCFRLVETPTYRSHGAILPPVEEIAPNKMSENFGRGRKAQRANTLSILIGVQF